MGGDRPSARLAGRYHALRAAWHGALGSLRSPGERYRATARRGCAPSRTWIYAGVGRGSGMGLVSGTGAGAAGSVIRVLKRPDGNVELCFTSQDKGFQVARCWLNWRMRSSA